MATQLIKVTLAESMNKLQSLAYDKYTFQESCNYYVKNNESGYGGIGLNDYTPQEAWSIIMGQNFTKYNLTELLNLKATTNNFLHKYTAEEAINKISSL